MDGTTAVTVANAITEWTTLVNGVMSIVSSNTVIMSMFCLPLIGGAVGLVKRLV